MRVLIGAYACSPYEGSEPGVGWQWTRAAALAGHDVTLVTRKNNRQAIEQALSEEPDLAIEPSYFDLPKLVRWKRGQRGIRLYYFQWQRHAAGLMRELHQMHRFDIAHHITLAVDWFPTAVSRVPGLPYVWGPVGGATQPPLALRRYLGVRGNIEATARMALGSLGRSVYGRRQARNAALVIALNPDVQRVFSRWSDRVVVEANSAFNVDQLRSLGGAEGNSPHPRHVAAFVGRLTPWKGLLLAVETLSKPAASNWDLHVYGAGPDMRRASRRAAQLGLKHRIVFHGKVDREDALRAISSADALLHPALHDSAPWAVGEAASLGTPTVCLRAGGPPALAEPCHAEVVEPSSKAPLMLADALRRLEGRGAQPTDRWSRERLPDLLDHWYQRATIRSRR